MMKKTLISAALVAGAFAGPLKGRLAQMNAKNLAQATIEDCDFQPITSIPDISLPECDCDFTELPGLGAGINLGATQEAQAL